MQDNQDAETSTDGLQSVNKRIKKNSRREHDCFCCVLSANIKDKVQENEDKETSTDGVQSTRE
jgi:hypothetical protein